MKLKNEDQYKGYDFAQGAILCIAKFWIIGFCLIGLVALLCNFFGLGVDDSDSNGWNRSRLKILTDAKTGIEYLSDGKGGLIERQSR